MLAQRPLRPGSFPVRFGAVRDRVIPDAVFADLYQETPEGPSVQQCTGTEAARAAPAPCRMLHAGC
jgi:hypothetical protein